MTNQRITDQREMIDSGSSQVVNLVLQGKGGVGKSLVASILAQFYQANGHPVNCIDTDPVNQTFSQYAGIGAQHLKLMDGNQVDRRRFDDLIEQILATHESFVIDNGAATFIPLWHYMIENSVIRVLREANRRLLIHTVLTGGQALADTVTGFSSLAGTCDCRSVIVWMNEYFGLVRRDGKEFTEMAVYREHREKVGGMIVLQRRSPDTFGRDIEEMISRKLTFDEVLHTDGLTLMSKQRLRMVQSQTFEQLEELDLLSQGAEVKESA
jgi:hypothetical protein